MAFVLSQRDACIVLKLYKENGPSDRMLKKQTIRILLFKIIYSQIHDGGPEKLAIWVYKIFIMTRTFIVE